MNLIFKLSKEFPELAFQELKSVLKAEIEKFDFRKSLIWKKNNFYLLEIEKEFDFSRFSQVKGIYKVLEEFQNPDELKNSEISFKGDFAVRQEKIEKENKYFPHIESEVGRILKEKTGNRVNLKNPEKNFRIFSLNDKNYLSVEIFRLNNKEFEKRKNENRPFKSPLAMKPKIARLMVNLSQIRKGEKLLDPFCGSGSILIEAGLMGINVYGSDIDERMVNGCKENLKYFGIEGKIVNCDISEISSHFSKIDAVVTALPYGRASRKIGEVEKSFLDQTVKICKGMVIFMYDKRKIQNLEYKYKIYMHKNLTSYIFIEKAENLK